MRLLIAILLILTGVSYCVDSSSYAYSNRYPTKNVAGGQSYWVGSSPKIAIGTDSASAELYVSGSIEATGNLTAGYLYGDGSNLTGLSPSSITTLQITGGGTNYITGASTKFGIGTTNPGQSLSVNGNITGSANIWCDGSIVSYGGALSASSNTTSILPYYLLGRTNYAFGSGLRYWLNRVRSDNSYAIGIDVDAIGSPTDYMVIERSTGRMGILTESPQATMDISGFAKLKVYSGSAPATCATSTKGFISFAATSGPCACNGSGWVAMTDYSTGCTW